MQPFSYRRASDAESAVSEIRRRVLNEDTDRASGDTGSGVRRDASELPAMYIAGGTNLIDYMTLGVVSPTLLVDINHLSAQYARIDASEERLRLGALVRMSEAEDHAIVRTRYPVIQQSLALAASRQIRNMASLGGNILQRTRCEYYRGAGWECNRRQPGSGCAALEGLNRQHAVLGTSGRCIATYAGDLGQALIALDASISTVGAASGPRTLRFAELHRLPGESPQVATVLQPGELITHIDVPAGPWTRRSCYVKIRDRQSYQFALTSAAVALHLDGRRVLEARIALGGVATVPWRAHTAEAHLKGATLDEAAASKAAEIAFAEAHPRSQNAFKVPLGKQTLIRAILECRDMQVSA